MMPFVFSMALSLAFGFACIRFFLWMHVQLVKQDSVGSPWKVHDPGYQQLANQRWRVLFMGFLLFIPGAGMLILFPCDDGVQFISALMFGGAATEFYLADLVHQHINNTPLKF